MWGLRSGKTMPSATILAAATLFALTLPAASIASPAAPVCPAMPPPEPAAYVAHLNEVNHGLGVPPGYVANHHLEVQPEAKKLVPVQRDVYGRKVEMAAPAAAALKRMFAGAAHDGIKLETVSGYRSLAYQTHLIRKKLRRGMSIQKALTINAVPGYSEHQTGCAIDLTTPGVPAANSAFGKSKAFTWLEQHAAQYGFHLSFPRGNKYGYEYEPWHWRYIAGSATVAATGGR
jgi:D-alanyl-D-alanine carboxypeptidase